MPLQATLLRVLDERRVRPLGSQHTLPVDVRIVASTNHALDEAVRAGGFRADLLYRLQVVQIKLPPLRAHKEDIGELVQHFIDTLAPRLGVPPIAISDDELHYLRQHDWPGNVRELRNLIERSLIVGALNVSALYQNLPRPRIDELPPAPLAGGPTDLHTLEKRHILAVLESVGGDKTQAARLLAISRRTLERRVAEWAAEH
jgi:transcriptional regulator with PAS, ATPase and Fis domain